MAASAELRPRRRPAATAPARATPGATKSVAFEPGEDLAVLHLAAFLDAQLGEPALDLRRDDRLAPRDDVSRRGQHGVPAGALAGALDVGVTVCDLDAREGRGAAPGEQAARPTPG